MPVHIEFMYIHIFKVDLVRKFQHKHSLKTLNVSSDLFVFYYFKSLIISIKLQSYNYFLYGIMLSMNLFIIKYVPVVFV